APIAGSGVTPRGLFRFVPGTGIQTVAYANQAAPGASPAIFSNFAAISMNATGLVSFLGSMTGGTIPRGVYQQSSTNLPVNLAFQNQASPLAGGTFNLFGTTPTRTLNSGSPYFFSDITGGAADYAEFLATTGSATVLLRTAD